MPAEVDRAASVNGVVGKNDYMFGKADLSKGDPKIVFTHPLSLVDVVVDGTGSIFSDGVIKSLTITADKPFVGEAACDLTTGAVTPAADGKSLTINYDETAKMNAPQHAWIAVYPTDLTDAGCSYVLTLTNGQEITFTANPTKVFEAQKHYTLTLNQIGKWLEAGKAKAKPVNLSAEATANCYIVMNGGYFQFDTKYVDKSEVANVAGADWLWATGSESKVSEVAYNEGVITFAVYPASAGNAMVAATDAAGNIVWSWHIWMTPEYPMTPHHYSYNGSWLMSDRNLGATSNEEGVVESYGLYYQWGRKDPFIGTDRVQDVGAEGKVFSSRSAKHTFNSSEFSVSDFHAVNKKDMGSDDLAYIAANPSAFVYCDNTDVGTTGLNHWGYNQSLESYKTLWNSAASITGAVDLPLLLNKTNYDPCPPGYCVPLHKDVAWRNNGGSNKSWGLTSDGGYISWEANTSLGGIIYDKSAKAEDNFPSYYPATGYRGYYKSGDTMNYGNARQISRQGFYWAASWGSSFPHAMAIYKDGPAQESPINAIRNNSTQRSWYAFPIRCMKQ